MGELSDPNFFPINRKQMYLSVKWNLKKIKQNNNSFHKSNKLCNDGDYTVCLCVLHFLKQL